LTTKIHAVVDALGNPLRILLTAGNVNDIVPATALIEGLLGDKLLADRAYDANKVIDLAIQQQMEVLIPPVARRLDQRDYDRHVYKERHLVECFFEKLKEFRRMATRYDKLSLAFRASVMIAACLIWLQ
jgi:transposase